MSQLSQEYEENVGISFSVSAKVDYNGDLTDKPKDQAIYLVSVCPSDTELRAVFTNRKVFEKNDVFALQGNTEDEIIGQGNRKYGFVTLHNFEHLSTRLDWGGNPYHLTVAKHEIGHVFNLPHNEPDQNSFMYHPSGWSKGQWTEQTKTDILKNKYIEWYPFK